MRNFILTFFGLGFGMLAHAQTDITTGGSYPMYLENKTSSGNGMLLHNATYSSTSGYQWVTGPHSTYGSRGIEFQYYSGILFYADNAATTASGNFSPTTRMFIRNDGNVGIGTTTPGATLDIKSNSSPYPHLFLTTSRPFSSSRSWGFATNWVSEGDLSLLQSTTNTNTPSVNRFMIDINGNVGIGTVTPSQKLEVGGNILQNSENSAFGIDALTNARLGFIKKSGVYPVIASDNGNPIIFSQTNQTGIFTNISSATLTERMRINGNGNVGIGTSSPDYPLTVNGSIHAKEVRVDLNVPAPDYVFEKDYQLTSLEDIKNYIDQNKHLPEVPSAKEMEKNGVQLGEMNMILLKKIEELTLHVIEADRKLSAQQQKLEEANQKIDKQQSQIDTFIKTQLKSKSN